MRYVRILTVFSLCLLLAYTTPCMAAPAAQRPSLVIVREQPSPFITEAAPPLPHHTPDGTLAPTLIYSKKPVARIMVHKADRMMYLLDKKGGVVRAYKIALGFTPEGAKREQGDGRTPEGRYTIDARNENSHYYKSLRISYPNRTDIRRAKKAGVDPGGDIFIHGKPNGKSWMWWRYGAGKDWTDGCIAVTDDQISEIWRLVQDGTPIDITP